LGFLLQLQELFKDGDRIAAGGRAFDVRPVDPPYHFMTAAFVSIGILLKFIEQVVQEGTFPAAVRTVEDVNFVLLGALAHTFDLFDQPIGKKSIGKKGVVGVFDK
jgi:hypothetical protein